jgi:hypothetical protein
MDSSSKFEYTLYAKALGVEQLPAFDPITKRPLLSSDAVFEYQKRLVDSHVRLHGPIQFPNEQQLAIFVSELPHEIEGSRRVYTREEIEGLVASVCYGANTLMHLPSAHNIRTITEKFLNGVILTAAHNHPEILNACFHPFLGTPIEGIETRARLALWFSQYDALSPESQNIFQMHGGFMSFRNQPHTPYFEHLDLAHNKQHGDGRDPKLIEQKTEMLLAEQNLTGARDVLLHGGATTLGCEYKFHILSKPEMHPVLIDRILNAFTHNPVLRKNLIAIKIRSIPEKNIPDIILYPRRGVNPTQAAALMQRIARELKKHLADFDHAGYNDGTPRFNLPLTQILYYAQAGGDIKTDLQQAGLLDQFFDATQNYAVLREEFQR